MECLGIIRYLISGFTTLLLFQQLAQLQPLLMLDRGCILLFLLQNAASI
nr:MAG TPA: hypothetical protein [Caudoviricetes sp.]